MRGVGLQQELQRAEVAALGGRNVFLNGIAVLVSGDAGVGFHADLTLEMERARGGHRRSADRDAVIAGDLVRQGLDFHKGLIEEEFRVGDFHRKFGVLIEKQVYGKTVFADLHRHAVRGREQSAEVLVDQGKRKLQRAAVRRDQNAVFFRNKQANDAGHKAADRPGILIFLPCCGNFRSGSHGFDQIPYHVVQADVGKFDGVFRSIRGTRDIKRLLSHAPRLLIGVVVERDQAGGLAVEVAVSRLGVEGQPQFDVGSDQAVERDVCRDLQTEGKLHLIFGGVVAHDHLHGFAFHVLRDIVGKRLGIDAVHHKVDVRVQSHADLEVLPVAILGHAGQNCARFKLDGEVAHCDAEIKHDGGILISGDKDVHAEVSDVDVGAKHQFGHDDADAKQGCNGGKRVTSGDHADDAVRAIQSHVIDDVVQHLDQRLLCMDGASAALVEDLLAVFLVETTSRDLTGGVHTAAVQIGQVAGAVARSGALEVRGTLAAGPCRQASGTGATAGKRSDARACGGAEVGKQAHNTRAIDLGLGRADDGKLKVQVVLVTVVHHDGDLLPCCVGDRQHEFQRVEEIEVQTHGERRVQSVAHVALRFQEQGKRTHEGLHVLPDREEVHNAAKRLGRIVTEGGSRKVESCGDARRNAVESDVGAAADIHVIRLFGFIPIDQRGDVDDAVHVKAQTCDAGGDIRAL